METGRLTTTVAMVAVIGWLATTMCPSEAQTSTDCATSLTPCASYINATHPPNSCCSVLKDAITTQKECLCNIFNNPSLLKSFNINVTDALTLPSRCKIPGASATLCSAVSPAPSNATGTTTSPPPPPPPPSGENGAGLVARSSFSFVLIAMAFFMFY